MYKRHNAWDEDKRNIHSSGYSSHSSGSSGSSGSGAGYSGQGSKNPFEHYHKSQLYGSNADKENKPKDFYRSNEQQEDDKKKREEGKERTLADAVQQEEKYQKKREQDAESEKTGINSQSSQPRPSQTEIKEGENSKKENKKSIEEAISDAIKEEKEVIHLD